MLLLDFACRVYPLHFVSVSILSAANTLLAVTILIGGAVSPVVLQFRSRSVRCHRRLSAEKYRNGVGDIPSPSYYPMKQDEVKTSYHDSMVLHFMPGFPNAKTDHGRLQKSSSSGVSPTCSVMSPISAMDIRQSNVAVACDV